MCAWLSELTEVGAGGVVFFFQAEDDSRGDKVTGIQTCSLSIYLVTVIATS